MEQQLHANNRLYGKGVHRLDYVRPPERGVLCSGCAVVGAPTALRCRQAAVYGHRAGMTGHAESAQGGSQLQDLLGQDYELVAFQCQLLIIAVILGSRDARSATIARNVKMYPKDPRITSHCSLKYP